MLRYIYICKHCKTCIDDIAPYCVLRAFIVSLVIMSEFRHLRISAMFPHVPFMGRGTATMALIYGN